MGPNNLAAAELEDLASLDRAGFLPESGESAARFRSRVERIRDRQKKFLSDLSAAGRLSVLDGIEVDASARIPEEIVGEAGEVTEKLYGFSAHHVPGFFLSRDVGLLWGGCMIADTEDLLSLFLIRGAFRSRQRWLFYRRSELLAHELCHSMRQSLRDMELEEFFAYRTSPSPLRRYLGNCFIRPLDAVLFVFPTLLLLASQVVQSFLWPRLPVEPFWLLALAYPAFLLFRNQRSRNAVFRAARKLKRWGVLSPMPVLFRCTAAEIRELGKIRSSAEFWNLVASRSSSSLRWSILAYRFLKK